MPDTYTLPRTGAAPVRFVGEQIAGDDNQATNGPGQSRWHDLAIYRADSGRWIAAIGYRTRWQGEMGRNTVLVADSPGEVARMLAAHDPTTAVAGFPPGEQFAERQARLLADVRARYESLVSAVLADADITEEVDSMAETRHTTFRFDEETRAAIARLRDLYGHDTATEAISHAVQAWEVALSIATAEVGEMLTRQEWGCLAECCNGTLWDHLTGSSRPGTMLAAEVEDAWRLAGTGRQWFADPTESVPALIRKLRGLSHAQGHAVVRAVCWFWRHHQEIDAAADEWWTVEFRREFLS